MTTAGRVIDSPITLNLSAGLNFIAIPYSTVNYTSYNLLNGQSHEIPGCTQVSEWTNSGWKGSYFTWGEPDGTNFTLIPGQGYFVRVSSDVQWTPTSSSSSPQEQNTVTHTGLSIPDIEPGLSDNRGAEHPAVVIGDMQVVVIRGVAKP